MIEQLYRLISFPINHFLFLLDARLDYISQLPCHLINMCLGSIPQNSGHILA